MPTPASPPAAGAPSRSAIVRRGATVTGHHLLDIDAYSHTKELPSGEHINCPFNAGGRSWRIHYYPNGRRPGCAAFISIYVGVVDAAADEPVHARAKFSLLDKAGRPVPSHTKTSRMHDFSTGSFGCGKFIRRAWLEKSELLEDDRFTIRCDVEFAELRAEERRAASPFVVVPPSNLHRHLGDLLAGRNGADVTFQVAGETFSAHRYVLAARSTVFRAELLGSMKEGTDTAAAICVDDMKAEVFKALLGFVYTDALPDDDLGVDQQEEATMAQHLLVAADRYNLERLKLICEDKLCKHIDTDSAATILALAEQHHCWGLKEACFQFLSFPLNQNAVMATEGFDHLTRSCPSVLEELMSNTGTRVPVDNGTRDKAE